MANVQLIDQLPFKYLSFGFTVYMTLLKKLYDILVRDISLYLISSIVLRCHYFTIYPTEGTISNSFTAKNHHFLSFRNLSYLCSLQNQRFIEHRTTEIVNQNFLYTGCSFENEITRVGINKEHEDRGVQQKYGLEPVQKSRKKRSVANKKGIAKNRVTDEATQVSVSPSGSFGIRDYGSIPEYEKDGWCFTNQCCNFKKVHPCKIKLIEVDYDRSSHIF